MCVCVYNMGCAIGKFAENDLTQKKLGQSEFASHAINPVFQINTDVDDKIIKKKIQNLSGAVIDKCYAVPIGKKARTDLTKFDAEVVAKYEFKKLIGDGTCSRVWMVENRCTKQPYAIKVAKSEAEVFDAELIIVSRLKHANIVQFIEVFRTTSHIYMVMELATGGDLFDRIESQGPFCEKDAVRVMKMVLDGVRYLHSCGVTHRDLKLDNLLFYHPGHNSKILITDFALASRPECPTKGGGLMNTVCGTPEYMAPEVFVRRPYTCAVDMWAVGVIAFTMLSCTFPFDDDSSSKLCKLIISGQYSYKDVVWNSVNDIAKDFIDRLLVVDPLFRMSAADALKHPWTSHNYHNSSIKTDLHRAISSSSSSSRSSHSGSRKSACRRRHMKQGEPDLTQQKLEWNLLRQRILDSAGTPF